MPQIHKKIEKYLKLKFKPNPVLFVDEFFPEYKSYEMRGASAIAIPFGSEKEGVYFLKKRLDSSSFVIHIIHEQIHVCLSQNKKKQVLIDWFEESVAIFYSILIYYELTKDMETIKAYQMRSYIFSKVKPQWDFSKRYFEYVKILTKIFLEGGFVLLEKLIQEYVNNKKDGLNKCLFKVQSDEVKIKYLPKNKIENFLIQFSNIVDSEQITPLEYLIVECLNKPKSIEEIAKLVNAPIQVTQNSVGSLVGKGVCLVLKDNKVDVDWRRKDLFDYGFMKPVWPLN